MKNKRTLNENERVKKLGKLLSAEWRKGMQVWWLTRCLRLPTIAKFSMKSKWEMSDEMGRILILERSKWWPAFQHEAIEGFVCFCLETYLMIFHPKFGRSPSLTSLTKAIFTWNKINISTSAMVSLRDKLDFKGGFKSNCKTEIGCYFLLQLNSLNFISYLSFLQLQSFQTFIPFLL